MKLWNKKTGEIADLEHKGLIKSDVDGHIVIWIKNQFDYKCYNSLAELNEEWEDYEEPKEHWFIDCDGDVYKPVRLNQFELDKFENIDNYFETREEAEKAVEKLKAWKRLKDKGFRFTDGLVYGDYYGVGSTRFIISPPQKEKGVIDDLKLLFGGED